jgi:hypothetical protein
MTQLAIYIPQVTVRVLKAQRTLAGDAVEADRIDGVASGDCRGCWCSGARRARTSLAAPDRRPSPWS